LKTIGSEEGVDTYFFSIMLGKAILKELVKQDILWAAAAGAFVFVYLAFHMGSFFLSFFSVMLIIFSFGIT
jgi:hypothetical protein